MDADFSVEFVLYSWKPNLIVWSHNANHLAFPLNSITCTVFLFFIFGKAVISMKKQHLLSFNYCFPRGAIINCVLPL